MRGIPCEGTLPSVAMAYPVHTAACKMHDAACSTQAAARCTLCRTCCMQHLAWRSTARCCDTACTMRDKRYAEQQRGCRASSGPGGRHGTRVATSKVPHHAMCRIPQRATPSPGPGLRALRRPFAAGPVVVVILYELHLPCELLSARARPRLHGARARARECVRACACARLHAPRGCAPWWSSSEQRARPSRRESAPGEARKARRRVPSGDLRGTWDTSAPITRSDRWTNGRSASAAASVSATTCGASSLLSHWSTPHAHAPHAPHTR